ncbi:MAG: acetyl-CoA carboxylase, carboxyltransferase subunit beta [Candidatus Sumerlaeaceae bacterium]|nr:acetyl-CoA carboxylase, carboxyltransferase subunit beta [Candidatus Sumerlaeaceae bacterium]
MAWFKKEKYTKLNPPKMRDRIPEGLMRKCDKCLEPVVSKDFEENLKVCMKCGHHHKLSARERIALITDEGSFTEMFTNIQTTDPLNFVDSKDYPTRIKGAKKSGYDEAVVCGTAKIHGRPVALAVMAFDFVGGSMGSVVGERITRTIEHGAAEGLPVIVVSSSGGARMQEGILSLMQMAKTSGALARLAAKNLPYISVLCDPSTAGVMASYASLGDVIVAEPDAQIGFAGPRVIEQTIRQSLPEGFQRSDFVREHGFLDRVVERKNLKNELGLLLFYMTRQKFDEPHEEPAGVAAASAR